jgi:thiamine phosphate synthase YjbQ (UPF0047 family)
MRCSKSGIRDGMILVSAMHIAAGVWVNDAEDGLIADIDEWLEKPTTAATKESLLKRWANDPERN